MSGYRVEVPPDRSMYAPFQRFVDDNDGEWCRYVDPDGVDTFDAIDVRRVRKGLESHLGTYKYEIVQRVITHDGAGLWARKVKP